MNPKFTKRDGLRSGMKLAAALAAVALASPAAAGLDTSDGRNTKPVRFDTIERLVDGVWCQPFVLMIGSPEEWDAAMSDLVAKGAFMVIPAPAAPELNWEDEAVAIVALGAVRGPAAVAVENVRRIGSHAFLDVLVQIPPQFDFYTDVAPHHIVKLDRRGIKTLGANYKTEVLDPFGKDAPAVARARAAEGDDEGTAARPLTWGALKAQY